MRDGEGARGIASTGTCIRSLAPASSAVGKVSVAPSAGARACRRRVTVSVCLCGITTLDGSASAS
eukprot:191333-Chlamydomonas_euryale.AAC.1